MKKILALMLLLASLMTFTQAEEDKFTMMTTEGKTLHMVGTETGLIFEEYKGKVVFLEFFGHRCPPCIKSIPHYKKLQEKYKDDLVIIAIEVQGFDDNELKNYTKEKGINYVTISQEKAGQLIPYISQRAQWQGSIPFLVILDKKGDVHLMKAGMLPEEALDKTVEELSK